MTPRRKQAITYLVASAPALWWGFKTFEIGGHSQGMAIAVSVACSFGILFAVCGMVMLFTTKKLGVLEQMEIRGREEVANEETAIRLEPQQLNMLVDEHVWSAKMVKEYRSLGETVKDCTAKRADIKAILTGRGIDINEDGNIEIK
tara:strand:+ start:648 stop:1085 length:438 start_codon:yes stop_codon:yes gene_type:complete